MLVFVRVRVRVVRFEHRQSRHGFVGQAQRMFAELRHNVHVSLCVLARQSACASEATPEIARALLSRHSVALRIQWLFAPTMLALEADVRRALARSRFYTAEFVEKHSHNIAALTIPLRATMCLSVAATFLSACSRMSPYNYATDCEQLHRWTCPQDEELQFFFLSIAWGVTTARQMSQRLACHYASYTGEAAVHDFEARQAGQSTAYASTLGSCGGTSSERTSVRMVPLVATNILKATCWKLQWISSCLHRLTVRFQVQMTATIL